MAISLSAGWAYIAPGGFHLSIKKRGARLVLSA